MERTVVKRRGKPNRGGGRGNRGGGGRGRGRGRGSDRGGPRGRGGGGWSSSRKGGLDLDDSIDGPCVNSPYEDANANRFSRESASASRGAFTRYTPSGRGRGTGPVKVEMQRLHMSIENQDMVRETLRSLRAEDNEHDFSDEEKVGFGNEDYDDTPEYDELDFRAEHQYWMTDRSLVVHNVQVNERSTTPEAASTEHGNSFAIKKLQKCGFNSDLCKEALQVCDGDMGAALEYLLNELFNISLQVHSKDEEEDISSEVLEAREEEKLALQSIYDASFEERLPNKVWALNLELPEFMELLNSRVQKKEVTRKKTEQKKEKVCPFYLKGSCKFKDRCRFSHSTASVDPPHLQPQLSHPIYANLNSLLESKVSPFTIEIRFPEGNRYPEEAPLVVFSSIIEELPAHTRLNITQYLMSQSREAAEDHLPCVFTLVSSLEDKEKLEELLSLPAPVMNKPVSIADVTAQPRQPFTSDINVVPRDARRKQEREEMEERIDEGEKDKESVQEAIEEKADKDSEAVRRPRRDVRAPRSNPLELKKQNKALQEEFRKKQGSRHYQNMMAQRQKLPAWDMRDLITEVIQEHQVVVISGMTGCGKTTQVPQFLMDAALHQREFTSNIVCTQPRRISAMAVAQRVAEERCEKLGQSVGYQIRLESVMSSQTRLLFCTTGIILRRLEGDPHLKGVTHIIIDEVHERSEESDFLLMILRDVLELRPDLKVILMSATLNAQLFSNYFGSCPVLEIPGRTFPVQQFFLEETIEFTGYILEDRSPYSRRQKPVKGEQAWMDDLDPVGDEEELMTSAKGTQPASDRVADMNLNFKQMQLRYPDCSKSTVKVLATMDAEKINFDLVLQLLEWLMLGEHQFPAEGAILVFMPGFAEIQTLYDLLLASPEFGIRNKASYKIIPLHSTLSSEDQNAVFAKPREGVTKIVIATNIAETSITIDDIVYVVDAGRMKEKRYDQAKSMESLETVWVSKANAMQRRGRAGRVREGVCFHLFTSHHFKFHLREQPIPEIQRAPLEQLVLKIKMLPVFADQDVEAVLENLIEAPTQEAVNGAIKRLQDLGALDTQVELSPLGYHLASLPVDVRIGKLMLFGAIFRCLDSALTIAASLSFKSPFVSPFGKKQEADEKKKEFAMGNSDYLTILNAYKGWTEAKEKGSHKAYLYCQDNFLSIKTLQMLASLKQQYVELLSDIGFVRAGIRLRDVERMARRGTDGVAEMTGPEANSSCHNWKLMSGMLVAALYPNIVQVMTPDTRYHASSSGAVVKAPNPEDLRFKTRLDGYVSIHPSSVNFQVRYYPSPYLVYHEKVKTTKVYVRDCSMVSVYPLLLFGGGGISIDLYQGNFVMSVDDGWIKFMASSPQVAELVRDLRFELDQLLSDKISQPDMNLATCPRGSRIIDCITNLISTQ